MGELLAWVAVLLVVVIGWSAYATGRARQQIDVRITGDRLSALTAAEGCYNRIAWARVQGPGDLNFRARGRRNPPTLSASVTDLGGGVSQVSLWTSAGVPLLLGILMWHGTLAWRKNSSVARKLSNR